MAQKLQKTKFPGVLYREHATRKHGVKRDRYYVIYYRYAGRNYQEACGWASRGKWTPAKCAALLGELKENQRRGEGPKTLKEKREMDQQGAKLAEFASVTFGQFFEKTYLPAQDTKKPQPLRREKKLYNAWLKKFVGGKTFADIAELDLEKIKRVMLKTGRRSKTGRVPSAISTEGGRIAEKW